MQFEQEKDLLFEIRGGKEQAEGDVGELDDVANKKQRSLRKLDNKTKTANERLLALRKEAGEVDHQVFKAEANLKKKHQDIKEL